MQSSGLAAWAVAVAMAGAAAPAHADLRGAPTPVDEAGCEVTVELDGPLARVREIHRLVPAGSAPTAAAYRAELAAAAIVDGFAVLVAGREQAGVVVAHDGEAAPAPARLGLPADLGVLTVDHAGARPAIDVRVYPVLPAAVTGFTVRWSAPLELADGRMSLTLPARGAAANLSRCAVRVEARAGGGVRGWAGVRAGGVWLGAGGRVAGGVTGAPPDRELRIEAAPRWSGDAPVLAAAHADLGGRVVSTLGIYVPHQSERRRGPPPRLLFVLDASRSLGDEGRRAAVALVESLGRALPAGTPVEAVLFDRTPRRALGAWAAADRGGLGRVVKALRDAPAAGGTDLASALRLASELLGDAPAQVVIVTDGVLPLDHTPATLLGHFPVATDRVTVDVVVPLGRGAALPEHRALDVLTTTFHGRVVAVAADQPPPAALLARDHGIGGLALEELRLHDVDRRLDVDDLPAVIAAGAGVTLTATLDRRPRRLTLRATRGERPVTVAAIALPGGAERLAVAAARGVDAGADTEADDADAAATLAAVRGHGVIVPGLAAVVLDPRGAGGAERLALARRTGLFMPVPPPAPPPPTPAPAAAPPTAPPGPGPIAGELPRLSVLQALRDQLVPRLRQCYREELRRAPRLGGALVIELEIARGEVMAVHLEGDHFPEAFIGCVDRAGHEVTTPTYALGGEPDTVYVIRKPIELVPPAATGGEPEVLLDDILYPAPRKAPAKAPAVPGARPAAPGPRPAAPGARPVEVEPDAPL
ncbi:MAG: VWA domain-containing protein [Kofleriaceae bacterium]|nr:VWA domain-containing protein [Kofleriaceae bacterium]